ncbi:MAG: hypothetical protein JXA67_18130, partial [Micromonosporaceae bacterium]|nr:hypothetical protein [Micromonosporaceae bacterium]
ATVDVNGVVAIAGQHGLAPAVAARWRTFPIDLGLPICTTLRTGRVDWLVRWPGASGGSEHRRPRPLGLGISPEWASTALLPLGLGGAGRGALMLVWRAAGEPAPARRREAEALAAGVAAILRRLPHSQPGIVPEANVAYRRTAAMDDPVTAVLDGLLDPVLLCEPVLGTASVLVDFRITHANPATTAQVGRETSYFDGRSFLELYPESLRTGLFEACRMVHTTGAQADLSNLDWRLGGPGLASGGPLDVRITRYRSGVLITCKQSPATSGAQL